MGKTFVYMRISTREERGLQKFTRQEQAIQRWCKENCINIPERRIYRDDASGKSFDRPAWRELEADISTGDSIIFKDICRFTREYEKGFEKYMDLLSKGIELKFLDNPTISTDYIRVMMHVADEQENRIAKKSLKDTIELLLLVELDRAEKEREIIVQRIKDGIAASSKKSGRKSGTLDKMTAELEADLRSYAGQSIAEKTIKLSEILRRHGISRNTAKKYLSIIQAG